MNHGVPRLRCLLSERMRRFSSCCEATSPRDETSFPPTGTEKLAEGVKRNAQNAQEKPRPIDAREFHVSRITHHTALSAVITGKRAARRAGSELPTTPTMRAKMSPSPISFG